MGSAKIGLIQVDLEFETNTQQKQDKLYELGRKCLEDGADIVFFPEAYQYVQYRAIRKNPAELLQVANAWKERCAELAKKYHAYVVPWDYEAAGDGNIYNTSYILDRSGVEIGRYRKVHLTQSELAGGLTPGNDFPVFDLDFGRVGIMICFDNYWPESARILALKGAELILYPLYGDTLTPQWEMKFRTRAIDNMVYVASCQLDHKYNIAYTGLVNPVGDVVSRLDRCPAYCVTEMDVGRPVITSTNGNAEYKENLAEYLKKCRNVAAYGALLDQPKDVWDWEAVFMGKIPK